MITIDLGKSEEERERLIQLCMLCLGVGILATDVFIPLGFVIWILYLMPLLMTVWLSNRYAPFVTAWLITFAILAGSIISGDVRSDPGDLPNRAIFILMMAIVALLVWEIRTNYGTLEAEVTERRAAQKDLEDLTHTLENRVQDRTSELSLVNRTLTDDIEKRRKIEAALATANQKLNLLSEITRHDLSNRVFALLVDLDLAKEYAEEVVLKETLGRLELTAMSIQDQIAFTRDYQEIGAQVPSWHPVTALVKSSADQLDLGKVQLDIRMGDVEVFADTMIRKVFFNLLDNALRHGDHVTRILFGYQQSGTDLVIYCEDNGAGIPDPDKQSIFKKGFGRNSGLGLFLIREILAITGISIRETGKFGEGARFELVIPDGFYRIGNSPD
jgi:signal transduction histidine kinase